MKQKKTKFITCPTSLEATMFIIFFQGFKKGTYFVVFPVTLPVLFCVFFFFARLQINLIGFTLFNNLTLII